MPDDNSASTNQSNTDDSPGTEAGPSAVPDDKSVQELLDESMPEFPEDRRETPAADDEVRMTPDEQEQIHAVFDGLIHTLYDRGFSPSELSIILDALSHRLNAARYDPYEYDRIALSIRLRETIEEWRAEQDADIPPVEIAEVVEELGRHYRQTARKNLYQDQEQEQADEEPRESETAGDTP